MHTPVMPTLTELSEQARQGLLTPVATVVSHTISSAPGASDAHVQAPGVALPAKTDTSPEPGEPYRTELITPRELASLAAKLTKQPGKAELGRALFRAIRGEPFAQQGQRNHIAFQLAGEIVEEYPNCDPDTVMGCVSASVSRVRDLGSKLSEDKWRSMIERLQDERRTRINMVRGVAGRLGRTLQEQAARVTERLPDSTGAIVDAQSVAGRTAPGALNTLFVLADGITYLRRPDEAVYRWALKGDRAIQVELANQFGTDNSMVVTHDTAGKALPLAELMPVYASNAHTIVHDYSSTATTWDPATTTLHVGLPDLAPEAEPCALTHQWLTALAGFGTSSDPESDVRDLYDWVSASAREHIASPAAGLVIVGDADTGKSALALALARTWGTYPVKLANAVERFNGALLTSPFWRADERMPDELTDANYRELVQERSRLVEPKGREKVELHGCGRIVITLNEPEDLRLGGLEGSSALGAVIDRIAYFDCKARTREIIEALDELRVGPGHPRPNDIDLERVVRHLRWVQTHYVPRAQRFLGARPDKSEARKLVLRQGVARQNVRALEAFLDYLNAPESWERTYHVESRQFVTGQRFPLVTEGRWLWVWPQELSARLGLSPAETTSLRKMVRSLAPSGHGPREISFGNRSLRKEFWPVDPDQLALTAGLVEGAWACMTETLLVDTRNRLPSSR